MNGINASIISSEEFILKIISNCVAILLLLVGCNTINNNEESESTETFIDEKVQLNANKWNRIKPNDFDYVFQRECYCITEYTLPVYLSVRDGRIVKAYHQGNLPQMEMVVTSGQLTEEHIQRKNMNSLK